MAKNANGGLVFSTNRTLSLDTFEGSSNILSPEKQELRIWIEKNHRGGKVATVIKGFVGRESDLEKLARDLKTKCGTGGSVKENEIIIQGDKRDAVLKILLSSGYKAKKAGG